MARDTINPNVPGLDADFAALTPTPLQPLTNVPIVTISSKFSTEAAAGAAIATLLSPLGAGATFATVGAVPAQLALSGANIVRGTGAVVAGTEYAITVLATSADGSRTRQTTIKFRAVLPLGGTPTTPVTPTPAPTIAFANPTASIAEGNSGTTAVPNTINVTRNGVTGALVVNLSYGGTAAAGSDYVAGPASVPIPNGANSVSFDLTVNGDTAVEPDESIVVNAVLADYSSATASKTITVTNDDSAASYTVPRLMDSGRMAWPLALTGAATSGTRYGGGGRVYRSPPYDTQGPRFCFVQMYSSGVTEGGVNRTEVAVGSSIVYEAVYIEINGVRTRLQSGGADTWTIADGGYAWTDDNSLILPANTDYRVLWATDVGVGGRHAYASNGASAYGMRQTAAAEYATADGKADGYTRTKGASYAADVATGATPANQPGNDVMDAPMLSISRRAASVTTKIPLVLGDSIGWSSRDGLAIYGSGTAGTRGYIGRSLISDTGGRVPHCNLSIPSQRFDDLSDLGFAKRRQMLSDVGDPFDVVLCEMGRNTMTNVSDLGGAQTAAQAAWNWIKAKWPGKPIVQTTITPVTSDKDDGNVAAVYQGWSSSSDANQFLSANEVNITKAFNTYVKTLPTAYISGYIDIAAAIESSAGSFKWKAPGPETTVAADAATGQANVTLASAAGFAPGDTVAFKTGVSTMMQRRIDAISGNVVTLSANISTALVVGDRFAGAATDDGLHPGRQLSILAAARMTAGKAVLQGTSTGV